MLRGENPEDKLFGLPGTGLAPVSRNQKTRTVGRPLRHKDQCAENVSVNLTHTHARTHTCCIDFITVNKLLKPSRIK